MHLRHEKSLRSIEQQSYSTTKNLGHSQPKKSSKMLRMPTSTTHSSISEAQLVDTPETLIVLTTSFIRQQIDTWIHDIMYHVSKQLVDIVKPMMQNEFQSPTFHKVGGRANIMHVLFNKASLLLHGYGLNRSMAEET